MNSLPSTHLDRVAARPPKRSLPAVEAAIIDVVNRFHPLTPDRHRLRPSQVGAVGHVVGVRGIDGRAYALKIYPAENAGRARIEEAALTIVRGAVDVEVPDVVLRGSVEAPSPAGFLLMSWLPGLRWAEHRSAFRGQESAGLVRQAGELLREIHGVKGSWFGDLLDRPGTPLSAGDLVVARTRMAVQHYEQELETAERITEFVKVRLEAVDRCRVPTLCQNDFNAGNIMIDPTTSRICGVFDFERASWGDPLDDLARILIQIRHHNHDLGATLLQAYGVGQAYRSEHGDEPERLDVYEVLHLLEERNWISSDRPAQWQRSIAALDRRLDAALNTRPGDRGAGRRRQ